MIQPWVHNLHTSKPAVSMGQLWVVPHYYACLQHKNVSVLGMRALSYDQYAVFSPGKFKT